MEEYLLKIDKTNPVEVVQRLKDKGIQVVHRFNNVLVVKGQSALIKKEGSTRDTKLIESKPLTSKELKSTPRIEDLPMLAFRLRQTKEFQQSSKRRKQTDKDKDWGEIFDAL